jgi:hypothetical protein
MPTAVDLLIGNPTVVNFAPNANVQQQIQNNYAMDFLKMRLTGSLVLASYSSAPTKFVESLENLIQTFSLTATGKSGGATTDQLTAVDGPFLRLKPRIFTGTDVTRTDVGTANGTYAFETNLTKYFTDPRSNAKALTRIFTAQLATLIASFQFRDQTAMLTGGTGGTATLSGVQVTTQARCYLGLTPNTPQPYVKETQRNYTVLQSQNLMRFDRVPTGNVLRRQYFKGMVGSTNYADPSDTIFGATGKAEGPHVQLTINSTTVKLDQVYQQMRADNKSLFSQESLPSGYAVFEPARDAKLVNSIALGNVQNADNFIDVNYTGGSTNTIQITDEQIVGLSAAQYTAAR